MRACLLGRSTTRAIHSFDDFIWTRERSALAIMRYCLPFDSVATARAALRQGKRQRYSTLHRLYYTRPVEYNPSRLLKHKCYEMESDSVTSRKNR